MGGGDGEVEGGRWRWGGVGGGEWDEWEVEMGWGGR